MRARTSCRLSRNSPSPTAGSEGSKPESRLTRLYAMSRSIWMELLESFRRVGGWPFTIFSVAFFVVGYFWIPGQEVNIKWLVALVVVFGFVFAIEVDFGIRMF